MKPFWYLIAALALGLLAPLAPSATVKLQAAVDPQVWSDTSGGQAADFLVVLRSQADLAPLAAGGPAATQRVERAYQSLRGAAAASQPALEAALQGRGVSYRAYWIVNMLLVHGGQDLVNFLAARPEVAYIEADTAFKVPLETPSTLPQAANPSSHLANAAPEWGIAAVHAPDLWALGFTGQGIVYANADTGVQWDHAALKNQYRGWNGSAADHNYNWWDAIHKSDNWSTSNSCPGEFDLAAPCDDFGHGTHTTGTGVGGDPVTNPIGMAPGAKWIACRNMNGGVGRPSTYIECLQFFMAPWDLGGYNHNPDPSKHADVISNSYSCPTSEGCAAHSLQAAVQAVRSAGIFMSVSAGNEGPACSSLAAPPALENAVFTVGAVDSNKTIASFSNRGPVVVDSTPLLKPQLVAPGVGVRSSWYHDSYASLQGTSMAAPHVAGAVALLWSAFPALKDNVFITQILLEKTASPLTPPTPLCGQDTPTSVPNNVYGYGMLDVLAAYGRQTTNPIVLHQNYIPLALK